MPQRKPLAKVMGMPANMETAPMISAKPAAASTVASVV